jgi:hypothetical protein
VTPDPAEGPVDHLLEHPADEPAPDAEPWVPPLWPRYVGVGVLAAVLVGCAAMLVLGLSDPAGEGAFLVVLGAVGLWYVWRELTTAWRRLQEARSARVEPT